MGTRKGDGQVVRPPQGPVIFTLDIETSPIESLHWKIWQEDIGLEQIQKEWTILSFAAKKLGDKKIIYHDTGGRGASKVRDDSKLLRELWKVLDEADIVVGQNSKRFDVKKIRARMIMAGMKPFSPIKQIDTCEVAKRIFSFTSNRLAWLSKHLTKTVKSSHKEFPGFSLWAEVLQDNPKAWAQMKAYNIQDVVATEELYLRLRPWAENQPNVGVYSESDVTVCPKCGDTKLQRRGVSVTQIGKFPRFQCQGCGGWSRGRKMVNSKEKRASLLSG